MYTGMKPDTTRSLIISLTAACLLTHARAIQPQIAIRTGTVRAQTNCSVDSVLDLDDICPDPDPTSHNVQSQLWA
jgi:hypothetical protein